ncbi:bifunctional alpha,alpha-trehalose-phosphate synthase (UDP-forming)/trehalose-phosphatase [Rudanella paleaurantiibacter]|uniref:Bifunctional alpha,alpha-trehalose-phosphate synthase (UDP-forming)/trehalose-phosphatase n=1 Tax=Rudanella paleaurantiibacter TaxID=2614655 RepID=A0A7J5TXZ5_9BACT|nr:bifunctional alpha,alpha-trehalose-phosphate synthase (UDP-forming)/trehalose-phosphatase [Rudanella paleaurantiibacter]KAB7730016.1 bifunctional alpha,alpha-trehalose-phosphate synthase (UDP-forming)/trehalose-phosphatase [Rudanella paleaurantiibacter]
MTTSKTPFNRLLIVSYRLPFTIHQTPEGLSLKQNAGGLVSAVLSMAERLGQPGAPVASKIHWVGHADPALQSVDPAVFENETFVAHPVFLDEAVNKGFYEGFSNDLLWPLFHYFPSYASFRESDFTCYQQANARFLEEVLALIEPGDLVWIHDFQLMLLPNLVREARPDTRIGYFFHIPFPNYEIIKLLPRAWRQQLIQGVLGADVLGFHTPDYVQHFLQSVSEVLALPIIGNRVVFPDRSAVVRDFPISVDFAKFNNSGQEDAVVAMRHGYLSLLRHPKLIFSVDRLDYTKGITSRLQGFERFLHQHPEWRDTVTFVMTVVPSRDNIPQYQEIKREIEETVGRINGLFGSIGWRPVVYLYSSLTFTELLALYTACDVALITPLRDGMNLVCKEFVASREDGRGVLILSELAGAAQELPDALIINPTDTQEVADAIHKALVMTPREQEGRMRKMRDRVQNYSVFRWSHDFLKAFDEMMNNPLELETDLSVPSFVTAFADANRRLMLVDFDGTLAPLVNNPADARPSNALKTVLHGLAEQSDLVVISGRNRVFLEKTFAGIPVYLVAEHGAFLKKPDAPWERLDLSADDWQETVREQMQAYVDRFPGSFVEEKETAIAWHYRMAEAEDIEAQAVELAASLRETNALVPLAVIQGSKVVEVKPAHHSKGTVALAIAEQKPYDFIVSIGDDTTDEDMFRQLPNWAYTLKVGSGTSNARYRLARQRDVETLLTQMSEAITPVTG